VGTLPASGSCESSRIVVSTSFGTSVDISEWRAATIPRRAAPIWGRSYARLM
jgi:hypothetical protein